MENKQIIENKSKLELIIGPMFSGKSTEIIKRVRLNKIINKKILIIKPKIDNRYIENKITSHDLESVECKIINNLSEISDKEIKYIDVLIDGLYVDEKRSSSGLAGSSNQEFYFLTDKISKGSILIDQEVEIHFSSHLIQITGFPIINRKELELKGIKILNE